MFATEYYNLTACNGNEKYLYFLALLHYPQTATEDKKVLTKTHTHAAWETVQQASEWHMAYLKYIIAVPVNIRGLKFMRTNFIARKFYRLRRMWRATSLHPSPEEATKWPLERPRLSGGLSFPATAIYLRTALIPNVSDQWAGHCSGGRHCWTGKRKKNSGRLSRMEGE